MSRKTGHRRLGRTETIDGPFFARIATVARLVLPRPHHRIELVGRFQLQGGQDVGVGVERDADLRVAQALLHDLRMHAGGQK